MYKKILICLDNSARANSAAGLGLDLASSLGSRAAGCHVYAARLHNDRFTEMEGGLPERYQEPAELERQRELHDSLITRGLELITDSYLSVFRAMASERGVDAGGVSREGKNFVELLREAAEGGYDLVVMGRRGLGDTGRGRTGSVCERVARRAGTDLIAGGEPGAEGPVVAAVDGSPGSFAALESAMVVAGALGRSVEAVSVFDPDFHHKAFRSLAGVLTEEAGRVFRFSEQEKLHEEVIDRGLARIYSDHLESARRLAAERGVDLKTTLLSGKAPDRIIDHAGDVGASLVALGRTGVHAAPGLDIGSAAENVLREAPCAVLLSAGEAAAPSPEAEEEGPGWTPKAEEVLSRIPDFARGVARRMVEDAAAEEGVKPVTMEFMRRVRDRLGF